MSVAIVEITRKEKNKQCETLDTAYEKEYKVFEARLKPKTK